MHTWLGPIRYPPGDPWQFDTTKHRKGEDGKTKRIAKLSEEQKEKIASMATPTAMPRDERKRQYAALRRAVVRSCEPALLAKFSLSSDGERWEG